MKAGRFFSGVSFGFWDGGMDGWGDIYVCGRVLMADFVGRG